MLTATILAGASLLAVLGLAGYVRGELRRSSQRAERLEHKLDLLLEERNISYDPAAAAKDRLGEALRAGRRIEAIKIYREQTGAGLKEAMARVEAMQAGRVGGRSDLARR